MHTLTILPEFAHGKVDPHEAGKQGGKTTGMSKGPTGVVGDSLATGQYDAAEPADEDDMESGDSGTSETYVPPSAAGDDVSTGTSEATGGDYKPKEHGGMRKDGQPDGRVKGN